MAKTLTDQLAKRETVEKKVSLTVAPQEPGSQDIHVEITRNLTAKKRRGQRRFAAFLFTVMFLMLVPIARDILIYFQMNEEYSQLVKYNQELLHVRQQLEEERDLLHTDEMIERLAREELDMVLPGESKVYQAIPTDDIPKRENLKNGEILH